MKKGSLSLSVNAIVVLILAITMLGLGLGFTKGMFGKVSKQVEGAITISELENKPTADNPVTLSSKEFTINRGDQFRLDVGYFNKQSSSTSVRAGILSCSGAGNVTNFNNISIAKNIAPASSDAISILVKAQPGANIGTYVCSLNATDYVKEVFITVK